MPSSQFFAEDLMDWGISNVEDSMVGTGSLRRLMGEQYSKSRAFLLQKKKKKELSPNCKVSKFGF